MELRTPVTLELVRHAQSQANVEDVRAREAGLRRLELAARDADVELSPLGERQARALGEWFAQRPPEQRPDLVLCSPYRRTVATAEAAIGGGGLDVPVRFDERLRERELGVFDGLTAAGVRERYPEEAERLHWVGKFYYRPPGGESWCDVALRVRSLPGLPSRCAAAPRLAPGGDHDHPLRAGGPDRGAGTRRGRGFAAA